MLTSVFGMFKVILLFTMYMLLIHCCVIFLLNNDLGPICYWGFLAIGKSRASGPLALLCI